MSEVTTNFMMDYNAGLTQVLNDGAHNYIYGNGRIAQTDGSATDFFLTDALGSVRQLASTFGTVTYSRVYDPYGVVSSTYGSVQSAYGYTGEYTDSYINLLWYGSRHYDPELGRFTSPDSIVPLASQGVQAWDRYGYANNNPLRYTDPTGHCIDGISTWVCLAVVLVAGTVILSADNPLPEPTNFPINSSGGVDCTSSLPGCFGDVVELKDFSEHGEDNPIPIEEFEEFADEVAEDLYTHDLTWPGLAAGRGVYDTPFYNGGESERRGGNPEGVYPADQQVCIETLGCSGRSEINYIAQGMWGAAVNETKPVSIAITYTWKLEEYFQPPSKGTIFWLKYGYDYYKQWLKEHDKK